MAQRLTPDMLEATDNLKAGHGPWYRRFHDPVFWAVFCIVEVLFQVVSWRIGLAPWGHH